MIPELSPSTIRKLAELKYTDEQIRELTPKLAAEILKTRPAPPLAASISKFSRLNASAVAETITTTWDEWLDHLATDPAADFAGQLDHGGWSAAIFDPPKRAKQNVFSVGALILDHDKSGDWAKLTALWGGAYGLIYTTKSHGAAGAGGDRLRVVLPLARPVTDAEYARIWDWAARRSAAAGCPTDAQCRDSSRFWYDTSTPPGGWCAERLTGAAIEPDDVLALPEPVTLRVVQPQAPATTDQRIKRASAYLAKLPAAVDGDKGHTTTFNAVAHVMIGFDLSESDTLALIANEYNPRCDPPWSEKEIQHKISSVSKTCKRERGYLLVDRPRIESTRAAASYAPPLPDDVEVNWRALVLPGKSGNGIKRAYHNVAVFVRLFPDYRGKWALDMMTAQPWFDGAPVKDTLVHEIRANADERLGFTPSTADTEAAIAAAAAERPFHPILQYLRSLDWDGVPRLDSIAADYLGSNDPTHAIMVRKFMIGAAARALWPGCKHDTALMLVGGQGIGKSTFFATLGGPWHADSFVDITNKDCFVQIHSAWIYELAELENVVHGKAESRLKAWLTSSHDMYRAPYQRTAQRRARAVVICGTTNRGQFLTDDTGSRRFWIVPVQREIPRQLLAEMRDQLWAEALCAAEAGEPWWLDRDTDADRERLNAEHSESDAWLEPIAQWVDMMRETTVSDVLTNAIKLEVARQDRWAQTRAARVLGELGFYRKRTASGRRAWRYIKGDAQLEMNS